MADDSELDYIRTFLGKVHTTGTALHFREAPNIYHTLFAAATQRLLVYPPELMGVYLDISIKRYSVILMASSEAVLMTMINNIIDGLLKLNKRETITDYTKPGVLLNGEFISGNKVYEKNGKWFQTIVIEFEWCTS